MDDLHQDSAEQQSAIIRGGRTSVYSPVEYIELPGDDDQEGGSRANLLEYWLIVRRHWIAIALLSVVFGLVGLLAGSLPRVPNYSARTTIELGGNDVPPIGKSDPFDGESVSVSTEVVALQSETLLAQVVSTLSNAYRDNFASQPGRVWTWLKTKGIPVPTSEITPKEALRMTVKSLKVVPMAQTRILEISCESPDPRMAADFANTLVSQYSAQIVENRWTQAKKTTEFLNRQLEDLRLKLQSSEGQLQDYTQNSGLTFYSGNGGVTGGSVAEQKLAQLQQELSTAQAARLNAESRHEMIKSVSADDLPDVIDSPALASYQAKLTDLKQQLADLSSSFTSEHYRVIRVQAQITAIEQAIKKEQANIINRIKNDYQAALQKEKKLEESYTSQSQVIAEQSTRMFRYDILKREVESNTLLYNAVLQQVKEAGINSPVRGSNVTVIDEARPRFVPDRMDPREVSVLGLLSGLVLGIGYSVARESSDRRLKSPGSVSSQLKLPELGVTPAADEVVLERRRLPLKFTSLDLGKGSQVELSSWKKKHSSIAQSFRSTATSVLLTANNGRKARVLVIASPEMGEGKTSTVTNLGIALAEAGKRVLLIDGDMHHPRLHKILNLPNKAGLAEILENRFVPGTDGRYAVKTEVPNMEVITSGSPKTSISRLLHSGRMVAVLDELRELYDEILIDTPPILRVPDARVLGRLADGSVLVFRAGVTPSDMAIAARERLKRDGVRILGYILNDWDPKTDGYGGGYYGSYYGRYSQNYNQREE